ncbi:hypothetical protein [Bacillus cereus group sp. BfR-BA-01317]|uniref:hypothetical protein n=1 Tax=Bacillus cereus group sp. BfR-BA-01317 TaxID=2920294 RepID=UPI001F55AF60|nr:hypothetical protein [Bacillus cereus group sp. BfR-BA-01317]
MSGKSGNLEDWLLLILVFFIVFFSIGGYIVLAKIEEKEDKKIEYRHEQSRKNAEISEGLLSKELNTEKKKFILSDRGGNVLDNSYSSYWVDKDLSGKVKTDDGEYIVYFDTEQIKKEDVEMYKPVKIKKIVKEG